MKATWRNVILAESDATVEVEGNQYFPPESVNRDYLRESDTRSTCAWKGEASYFHLVVEGDIERDGAWTYPSPAPAAARIRGHVAFGPGVEVGP